MKVGLLSDTHGWIDPQIQEVLSRVDCIVHAGDIMGAHVLETLQSLSAEEIVAVAGNNDFSEHLPEVAELTLPGGTLVVTHGDRFGASPQHAQLRQTWPQARAIVYGHTHRVTRDQEARPWVLNPGAAGRTRVRNGPSCMMLLAHPRQWDVEIYQFPRDA